MKSNVEAFRSYPNSVRYMYSSILGIIPVAHEYAIMMFPRHEIFICVAIGEFSRVPPQSDCAFLNVVQCIQLQQ